MDENRLLDDVAGGLGHEAAHAGELAHLLAVAARAGIHHEINRVVFLLALVLFERAEHDVGDLVGAMRPDVDDLVVAFAGGDDAFAILLFDFLDLLLRGVDFLVLSPSGMIMSSMPMDTPALVASRKPSSLSLSSMTTVFSWPQIL